MFTFNGRDAHRSLPTARLNLPFQRPIGEILPEKQKTADDDVTIFFSQYFYYIDR
jgi:Chs5-Arf1p-binding protein BUD7/BCH1